MKAGRGPGRPRTESIRSPGETRDEGTVTFWVGWKPQLLSDQFELLGSFLLKLKDDLPNDPADDQNYGDDEDDENDNCRYDCASSLRSLRR